MFKVNRTYPAPKSLSKKVRYDGADVHEALQECFYGKCGALDGESRECCRRYRQGAGAARGGGSRVSI